MAHEVTITVKDALAEALNKRAVLNGVTVSEIVNRALNEYFSTKKREKA